MTRHGIQGAGILAGTRIGSTWILPPTLTLQYHFDGFGPFKPYVGVGVNYTHYFSNGGGNPNFTNLSIKDSWGVAGQIGFDYMIDRHWGFNVDVKKIMMQPKANVTLLPGDKVLGPTWEQLFNKPEAKPARPAQWWQSGAKTVLSALGDEVSAYEMSKGSLRFAIDEPLPKGLIEKLIAARMSEVVLMRSIWEVKFRASSKNSLSLGFDPGQPPSI